jgi:hypothetical protein
MENGHSRLGVASFTLSLGAVISLLIVILLGHFARLQAVNISAGTPLLVRLLFAALIAFVVFDVGAAGLGIASFLQRSRRHLFGILGVTLALLMFIWVAALTAKTKAESSSGAKAAYTDFTF